MFKVNNRNSRTRCEICSKLTIKTPEDVIDFVLLSLLLTLTYFTPCSSVFITNFEQVNADWVSLIAHWCISGSRDSSFIQKLFPFYTRTEKKSQKKFTFTFALRSSFYIQLFLNTAQIFGRYSRKN